MSILPPDTPTPTPPDEDGEPRLVELLAYGNGTWTLTIRPGADGLDFAAALSGLPDDVCFVESFGDVEATLLFRPDPDDTSAPATPAPAGMPARGGAALAGAEAVR
ncbi:hypothetical protein I6A60_40725 [Frankia sp. AgB1.9]|uniref:hypothetical protein n=1 Tax=unclassified Frankia TaxID=2632575 RepID=UPI0019314451|nr:MULTISPECIES: hypothetical protein [unclassified Frankia]MBL7489050.1 hypothetical protein [Frankia sp. AgW1.1]MBL7554104.1 hypothetical protein [Frankia sp. AgB1.9]MBL7618488.1 hypothetical protein [Frankia sp. AgB1.8]